MKDLPVIKEILDNSNGFFIGENKPHGRVTVEPYWGLNMTDIAYSDGVRGPYRWFQSTDEDPFEVEVPNISTIQIDRSIEQPVSKCVIRLFNQSHNLNDEPPELQTQLGKPGFYWFERGRVTDPESIQVSRWNQSVATGAVLKNGEPALDPVDAFEWFNVLVPNALLRTYQGYGGHGLSITEAEEQGFLTLTGVWIVNDLRAGTDGTLSIECSDVGKLLSEQVLYPPLVPSRLYPLQYSPPGATRQFNSPWEPQVTQGTLGSVGTIPMVPQISSIAIRNGDLTGVENTNIEGHYVHEVINNDPETFSLTQAAASTMAETDFWQFMVLNAPSGARVDCSQITVYPYGGGYMMYISIAEDGINFVPNGDGSLVPGDYGGVDYVDVVPIPVAEVGQEVPITIDLPRTYNMSNLRLSFRRYPYLPGYGYRAGLRDVVCYKLAPAFDIESIETGGPACETIARHPVRGYWVTDQTGHTYGFGDAADYDTSLFGSPTITSYVTGSAGAPDGRGYLLLEANGAVHAEGTATHYGERVVAFDPEDWYQEVAMDIALSYDGSRYWVIYSTGEIWEFSSGGSSLSYTIPLTDTMVFMEAVSTDWTVKYLQKRGTAICSHPSKLGYWACNGSGEVFTGGDDPPTNYGGFQQRVYNPGLANSFKLTYSGEWVNGIDSTISGNGYWLVGGSGRIAQFGDAIGKGPVDLYADFRDNSIPENPYAVLSPSEMRDLYMSLVWDMVRGPENKGFYAMAGSGDVVAHEESWWGAPTYWGWVGTRWTDGTYRDLSDIVKDVALWSGFLLYSIIEPDTIPVHGEIEGVGFASETKLPVESLDKKSPLDVINMLREVVGYICWINDEGGLHFTSPNWWKAGNFYTNSDGLYTETIPVIDERLNLLGYSASISSSSVVSRFLVGTVEPRWNDPTITSYYSFVPSTIGTPIKTGTGTAYLNRGMSNPFIWMNAEFKNPQEMKLMAQMVALHTFFSQRFGSVTMVADPSIQINDQVRIIERNTSEAFIHYVRGISSKMDTQQGDYTMTLTTNWLGSEDNWVITRDNVTNPITEYSVSELIDAWAESTDRGFVNSNPGFGDNDYNVLLTGAFDAPTYLAGPAATPVTWTFSGTLSFDLDLSDCYFTAEVYTDSILGDGEVEFNSSPLETLTHVGQLIDIGDLVAGSPLLYSITGTLASVGTARIVLRFWYNGLSVVVSDTAIVSDMLG